MSDISRYSGRGYRYTTPTPTASRPPRYNDRGWTRPPSSRPPTPPPATPAPPPDGAHTPDTAARANQDAYAYVVQLLTSYGLGELAQMAWNLIYVENAGIEYVMQQIRQSDTYRRRFPGMEARRNAGLPAMSETEYLQYETTLMQIGRAYGLPEGFYDEPSDFATFMSANISPAEFQERVVNGYVQALNAPAEVRDELARLYGVDTGALAAYYLDPDRALPVLERQFNASQVAAAGMRTGFGQVSMTEAERLTALGVTGDQAQSGFAALTTARGLFERNLSDAGEQDISRQQQLGAAFEGDALAQEAIENQARRRVAAFQGGGGFASSREGFAGIGRADR